MYSSLNDSSEIMVIFWAILCVTLSFANCSDLGKWHDTVFPPDYNELRPDQSLGTPLNVSVKFIVDQITEINDQEGTIELLMTLYIFWPDFRLLDHKDKSAYSFKPEAAAKIWKPTLYMINAKKSSKKPAMLFKPKSEIFVQNGVFVWLWDIVATVYCDFDFGMYPFDVQRCSVRMANIELPVEMVRVQYWKSFKDSFQSNSAIQREQQFKIIYHEMDPKEKIVHWEGQKFSAVGFQVKLVRDFSPFLLNIYLPSFILVTFSWISFWIPPEIIPGRMGLLVTIYLVLANIGNGARVSAPTHGKATVIDLWLQVCQAFDALALFEYAFLLYACRRHKYMGLFDGIGGKVDDYKSSEVMSINADPTQKDNKPINILVKRTDDIACISFPITFFLFVIIYSAAMA